MSMYLGDFAEDSVVNFCWSTNNKSGASIAPSVAGTIKVYKANSNIEVTSPTGITDTRAFDGLVGIHQCSIDLSANAWYAAGNDYAVVLSAATIDSEVVNAVLATFSIQNRYMRGTDNAALASVCTESRLAELDAANMPVDVDTLKTRLPQTLSFTDGNVHSHIKAEDNIDFGTTKKASINAEVDVALDTAIPSSPAANSVNERIKAMDDKLPSFDKVAKVLINKAVQNKSTGEIRYYDDDGATVILTHTPTDEESTITRTPS